EWAGFDRAWLEREILEKTQGSPRGRIEAVFNRLAFLHAWQEVRKAYEGKPDFYPKWWESLAFYLFFVCHPYRFFILFFFSYLLVIGVLEVLKRFRF
ncbi:MAG TPA: hypothetical protein VMV05_00195, partial [bacterium]|nr:hypothetical protein [bacterium]